ncbi:MAG: DUF2155 domain-containing protein [Pseudomonadota bacterium]
MPPEVAPPEGGATTPQATLPNGQIPPIGSTPAEPGVSVLRRGADGPVRVIFDQNGQPVDGPSGTGPSSPENEATTWQRDRDGGFLRAPQGPSDPQAASTEAGALEPIEAPDTVLQEAVRVRELDKMTGQVETVSIQIGAEVQVGRLLIRAEACRSPESGVQHGTVAFLKIRDIKSPESLAFSGWMFAESPAISAMDHPRYDVWVLGCVEPGSETSGTSN